MASEAQVVANRLNAQKSTGPRTPEGKATVAQNAVKHGLSGRQDVILGEDPGEFESHRDWMLGELAPVGAVESMLAERVVGLAWRLRRAERIQNQTFDALLTPSPLAKLTQSMLAKRLPAPARELEAGELALGRMAVKDFANNRVLDRLLMYERRIEHSLFKTLAELQRLRITRELETPGEGPAGSVPARPAQGDPKRDSSRLGNPERPRAPKDVVPARGGAALHAEATGEETPLGVPTNAPAAGACPPVERPHHDDIPALHPSIPGPGQPARDDPSCKTNPIPPRPNEDQAPCGKGVAQNSSANGLGKTDPISMGKGQAERAVWEGLSTQTQPAACRTHREGL